jgi:hypothetical protein
MLLLVAAVPIATFATILPYVGKYPNRPSSRPNFVAYHPKSDHIRTR